MLSPALSRYGTLLVWLAFIAGLTFVFGWLLEKQHNPNQSNITRITSDGSREVELKRNRSGHYIANGEINGSAVQFILDTGATDVSIPLPVAKALNLKQGAVMLAQTANGTVRVYATRLDRVALGGIELSNVAASINPGMEGREILLGMSFLGHLEMIQRDDRLRLRVPSS